MLELIVLSEWCFWPKNIQDSDQALHWNRQWNEVPETRCPQINLKLIGSSVHGVKFSLKKKVGVLD